MLAYVSLYRKYRPQTFEDVVGQTHVTQTLVNAIAEDRLHHAYLFTGPRGTGKTSTARILAKALNCEQGPTPTPCNECDICTSITAGSAVDVIELDMASHGGVDDARELRDRALFAPAVARHKVYILDEVHMASTAAFNALLKLIEEPPGHVVFAMATTDPQKVIPTIMSRVQRLDLRRVSAEEVAAHVRHLCELEGYTIEDEAVDAVVRAGDGSVRDTMSILEQVLSFSGKEVTGAKVAQTLGQTPAERTFETVDLISARDLGGLLGMVQGLMDEGHDLRRFTFDLLQHLRDLLVLQVAPDRPDLVDATQERRDRLAEQSGTIARETLLRAVDLLAGTVTEQRQGPPRLPIELALAKLAVPAAGGDVAELADRLARLEAGGGPAGGGAAGGRGAAAGGGGAAGGQPGTQERPRPRSSAPTQDRAPSRRPAEETPTEETPTEETPTARAPAPEPSPAPDVTAAVAATDPATEPDPSGDVPTPGGPVLIEPELAEAAPATPGGEPVSDRVSGEVDRGGLPPGPVAEVPPPDPDAPARGDGADDLATIRERWEAILDLVKEDKRRFHAVYEPADPVALKRGILTLHYPARYRSFHAENATKGEYAGSLQRAVERACGLKIKVDVKVDGDGKRAPKPPDVTPAAVEADPAPEHDPEEEAAVREAEHAPEPSGDTDDAAARAAQLLSDELGAERIAGADGA